MAKYIAKRMLVLIPVMCLISFVSFFLIYLSPGDPAQIFLSQDGNVPSAEAVAAMRERLGLDRPVAEQYAAWIIHIFRGDLGTSISTGTAVSDEIRKYFPNTLKLTALAMLLTCAVSIPLGVVSAVRENRLTDNLIRLCSFTANSLPGFFAALLLIYLFAVKLRWLPTISTGSGKGIILPALTLALTMSAVYIRQIRASLIQELQEDYIRMQRARGIRERTILFKGAFKSILPSILTLAGINVGHLLGGTAIIELVCTYPGIGRLAVQSVTNRDYPMIQGYVLMMALVYVLVNLTVDILHAISDPRVRHQILTGVRPSHER